MSAKPSQARKPGAPLRYLEEDLVPPDTAEDEAFVDRFIKRNRVALNAALKAARASIKQGKGTKIKVIDQAAKGLARASRRSRGRKS